MFTNTSKVPVYLTCFMHYLEAHTLVPSTQKKYAYRVHTYLIYLQKKSLPLEKVKYANLLDYIGELQTAGKSKGVINHHLRAIGYYLRYQKLPDITHDIHLRGIKTERNLLFTEEELQAFYNRWQEKPTLKNKGNAAYYHHSNQILLGLILFQAISRKELFHLRLSNVNLQQGTIYLSGGTKVKAGRTLHLQSFQVIPLYAYIKEYRRKTDFRGYYQGEADQGKLFSPNADKFGRIRLQLQHILQQLKTLNPDHQIKSLQQLQQSRIAIWIKQHGLRKAQYLAGYKSVSSIEKYQDRNVEELKALIKKHHPLR